MTKGFHGGLLTLDWPSYSCVTSVRVPLYFWYIRANRIPKYAFSEKLGRVEVASKPSRLSKLMAAADRNCTSVTRECSSKLRQSAYGPTRGWGVGVLIVGGGVLIMYVRVMGRLRSIDPPFSRHQEKILIFRLPFSRCLWKLLILDPLFLGFQGGGKSILDPLFRPDIDFRHPPPHTFFWRPSTLESAAWPQGAYPPPTFTDLDLDFFPACFYIYSLPHANFLCSLCFKISTWNLVCSLTWWHDIKSWRSQSRNR